MARLIRPWNVFSGIFGPRTAPASFVQTRNDQVPDRSAEPEVIVPAPRYEDRLTIEKRFYENYVNIQDLPAIHIYWAHELVRPKLATLGFSGHMEMFKKYLEDQCARDKNSSCRFVSLGAGNCDIEIELAKYLCEKGHTHFVIECLDLNGAMLERGRIAAIENEVAGKLDFIESDFNDWQPGSEYDAVVASQVLHHVVNLEGLFSQIQRTLKPHGQFLIGDMIGRNGHQRWPEALDIVHEYWRQLPASYRFNRVLNRYEELYQDWDCSRFGFEGIRAQDILPLLLEHFHFQMFFGFGNAIDPFVDRAFGHNFDSAAKWDRDFIYQIHQRDEEEILAGRIKPTHMLAVVGNDRDKPTLFSAPLSPEFCVRRERPAQTARAQFEIATCVLSPTENSGLSYDMQLKTCGGHEPYTWSATDLPPGLRLTMEGRLAGAIETDGVFTPVITTTDSSKPSMVATQRYTIIVKPAELIMPLTVISPRILGNGLVGEEYEEVLLTSGGSPPLHWTIESGAMPSGLMLGAQSGEIRGTATRKSRDSFHVKVTDATGKTVTSQHEIAIEAFSENVMKRRGVLPHIAADGDWQGAIHLINAGKTPIDTALNFYASSGRREYWMLRAEVQSGSEHGRFKLAPHATLRVDLAPVVGREVTGWVEIIATGPIGAHAELLYTSPNGVRSNVTIPMVQAERQMLQLAFDNSGGNHTCMALLNVPGEDQRRQTSQLQGLVSVVRDELGQWIETRQFPLRPGRHKAFMLADEIPATAGRRGTIEIQAAGPIGGVSLRISAQGIFVLLPPI